MGMTIELEEKNIVDFLATKADIALLETKQSERISNVKTELTQDISDVRIDIIAGIRIDIAEVRTDISDATADLKQDISYVRAEVSETKAELKQDISDVRKEIADVRKENSETKAELKQDISDVRKEISETKAELKQDISDVRKEIAETKAELKQDISDVRKENSETKAELKQDISDVRKEIADVRVEIVSLDKKIAVGLTEVKTELSDKISKAQTDQKEQFKWFVAILGTFFSIMVAIMLYMMAKIDGKKEEPEQETSNKITFCMNLTAESVPAIQKALQ